MTKTVELKEKKVSSDLFMWIVTIAEAEAKGKHEFICPLCGGKAEFRRVEINHHLRAWCNQCGMRTMS